MFTQTVSTLDQRPETASCTASTNSLNKFLAEQVTTSASTRTQNDFSGVSNVSVERVTASSAQCQRNCAGISRFSQTDPEQQDRAVNTKLKQRKLPTPMFARKNEQSAIQSNIVAGGNSGPAADICEGEQIQSEPVTQVKSVGSVNLRPFQGESKHVVRTRQPELRQCFYCHEFGHEIWGGDLYQQKKSRRRGNNPRQGVRFSRTNNKTVGWKEVTKNEQYIITRSTTERTLCTQQTNVGIVSAVENCVHNTQHTNHSLLPAVKDSVHTTRLTNVNILAATKDNVTAISESKAPTKMTEARGCSSVLSSRSSSINDWPVKTPDTSAKFTSTAQQEASTCPLKVPENSAELATFVTWKINDLLANKKIQTCACLPDLCVYCRRVTHFVSDCSALKEKSVELKRTGGACLICETNHDMPTCEWLQILSTVDSLTSFSRARLDVLTKVFDNYLHNKYKFSTVEFAWANIKSVVANIDWISLGIKSAPMNL
ncbi:hypothetical protein BsWGS_05613 [Bradybaena similaris]